MLVTSQISFLVLLESVTDGCRHPHSVQVRYVEHSACQLKKLPKPQLSCGLQPQRSPKTALFDPDSATRKTGTPARGVKARSLNEVPGAGLEPARLFRQGILNPQCLPFHHPGRMGKVQRKQTQRLRQVRKREVERDKWGVLCSLGVCQKIKVWNRSGPRWMRTMSGRAYSHLNSSCRRIRPGRCWNCLRMIRCSRGNREAGVLRRTRWKCRSIPAMR